MLIYLNKYIGTKLIYTLPKYLISGQTDQKLTKITQHKLTYKLNINKRLTIC